MNSPRHVPVPADGRANDIDRKALWVVSERALPTIVRSCVSCRSTRHRPTGKIRVNANHKLLDVWLLICCELCGRTSKIPVHERVAVRALDRDRLLMFENNDPAVVRQLTMDATLARRAGHQLDWAGTWRLDTDLPFYDLQRADAPPLEVIVRFELPAPVRVERLLTAGFGLGRPALRGMVDSGRIRLLLPVTARASRDFRFLVVAAPLPAERA
ncbi:DUF1062 domain-containing protein [Micromonospora wenchangensis]|uniref:DUF1062 domain-containing protein n=1 Tax=Micromonospora wenchangensis TaxID=1185415 RepID=UPI0034178FDE